MKTLTLEEILALPEPNNKVLMDENFKSLRRILSSQSETILFHVYNHGVRAIVPTIAAAWALYNV